MVAGESCQLVSDGVGDEALVGLIDLVGDDDRLDLRHDGAELVDHGVDDQFGRILSSLQEESLEDDTIVLFTSDHGDCLGIHDFQSKSNCYEESVRIPFLLRWPGRIEPRVDDLLISVPDIYPTLLGLMDMGNRAPVDVEGSDHTSVVLTGTGSRPSSQLYVYPHPLERGHGDRGVRTHRYTMVINKAPRRATDQVLLFDNEDDPFQIKNIAGRCPDTVRQLLGEELIPWLKHTRDPMPIDLDGPREAAERGTLGGLT